MKENKLSIIIPVYNGLGHSLPQCLDSIFTQEQQEFVNVICIDDCSTDNTFDWLKNKVKFTRT